MAELRVGDIVRVVNTLPQPSMNGAIGVVMAVGGQSLEFPIVSVDFPMDGNKFFIGYALEVVGHVDG